MYYVGYTNDYLRRLKEHNEQEKFNTFTSKHRPWDLKAAFACGNSESDAVKIERFIKKQKSKNFIERLILADNFTGSLAQLVRVPKLRD